MKKLAVVILIALITSGCVFEEPNSKCEEFIYHNREQTSDGIYISSKNEVFYTTVDYENKADFLDTNLISAKNLGMMAWALSKVYKEEGHPNAKIVQEKLSNVQFIITSTDQELAKLTNKTELTPREALKRTEQTAAFIFVPSHPCFADVESEMVIVARNNAISYDSEIIPLHELAHIIEYFGFKVFDKKEVHNDKRLWYTLDQKNSIMAKALKIYKKNL